jgi:hypothetical protein
MEEIKNSTFKEQILRRFGPHSEEDDSEEGDLEEGDSQ